jgi:hypothetical protein
MTRQTIGSKDNYAKYVLSSDLVFDSAANNYQPYYLRGLSIQEAQGVWSLGNETDFVFIMQEDARENLVLEFTAKPLIGGAVTHQSVEIMANGVSAERIEITEDTTYRVSIPVKLAGDGRLELQFMLPTATTPKALSLNNDERVLALFFRQMAIHRAM